MMYVFNIVLKGGTNRGWACPSKMHPRNKPQKKQRKNVLTVIDLKQPTPCHHSRIYSL